MLLLKFLHLKSTWAWSLSNLDAPFHIPLVEPQPEQLGLLA